MQITLVHEDEIRGYKENISGAGLCRSCIGMVVIVEMLFHGFCNCLWPEKKKKEGRRL